ncbi:MAG: HD domain-containing protein [Eubacteriaceae bacterium]|nr:HD domain-containing protein [Eubacteriaceae bacterium]
MSQKINIKDMNYGDCIKTFLMIKNIDLKKAKNDAMYLDMILGDSNGSEANAKLWNADSSMAAYKNGDLVFVDFLVQKFNNKVQLRLNTIRKSNENDPVKIEEFVEAAPDSSESMFDLIQKYIEGFVNEDLKLITSHLIELKKEKLEYYPAAKTHHHAVKAGLLYHVVTMLKLGDSISRHYEFINRDLLFSGIILHDLSKVDEMDSNELGIVEDYTKEGKLLGHIIQGINEIDRAAAYLGTNEEVKLLLQHMLLTHHYHAEYGSPKKPLIPEAELLHYIDLIDARMYTMNRVLDTAEEGGFADRSMTLEGRNMYKAQLS